MRILLFLLVLFSNQLFAADSLQLIHSFPIKARLFTTDPSGNMYVVAGNNSLYKYTVQGDSVGFFNEIKKGKITQIDATNPMRILLYYADYGQIIILDHLLSKKSSLKLSSLGFFNVNCIANSADGQIWIYDPISGTLYKIDENPSIRFETNLRNVIESSLNPVFLVEQDRTFFLVDSSVGILKFDQYGLFKLKYDFKTKEAQFFNNYLVYYHSPFLFSYNTTLFSEEKLRIPDEDDVLQVRIERNAIYVLRNSKIDIYHLGEKR